MIKYIRIVDYGTIEILPFTLDISLRDILSVDRIELPKSYDLRHAQIMEALYKIKNLLDRQEMLNYIQSYLDPSDDIPQWINAHPDKTSQLLDWWEAYLDDETTYREALNLAFEKMMREEFKNENRT